MSAGWRCSRAAVVALGCLSVMTGCGSSQLSKEEVTSIPPGNATGSSRSGAYSIEVKTRSCSGQCPSFKVLGFTVRICSEGSTNSELITVTQTDGVLEVSGLSSSMYVQQLKGGIDADGSFDVGGYQIQENADVGVAARVKGTIDDQGRIVARASAYGNGTVDGKTVSCTGEFELTGERR